MSNGEKFIVFNRSKGINSIKHDEIVFGRVDFYKEKVGADVTELLILSIEETVHPFIKLLERRGSEIIVPVKIFRKACSYIGEGKTANAATKVLVNSIQETGLLCQKFQKSSNILKATSECIRAAVYRIVEELQIEIDEKVINEIDWKIGALERVSQIDSEFV